MQVYDYPTNGKNHFFLLAKNNQDIKRPTTNKMLISHKSIIGVL